jgi:hypothetical protein
MLFLNFSEGLGIMKLLAINDLFKVYYKLEPSVSQTTLAFIGSPSSFKFLTGILIDAKFVSKRKYYLIFFSALQALMMLISASFTLPL